MSLLSSLAPAGSEPPERAFKADTTRRAGRCNAYELPGFVSHIPYPVWKAFDPTCESPELLPNLLGVAPGALVGTAADMRKASVSAAERSELQSVLQNRTVLLVGDAVDRTMIQSLCSLLGHDSVSVDANHIWGDALKHVPSAHTSSADHKSSDALLADYCYEPVHDTLFTSFYHYGADTDDLWRKQEAYSPPSLFEHRMTDLLGPYLKALSTPHTTAASRSLPPTRHGMPDLVLFSSNFWDLAVWAQEDASNGVAVDSDLSSTRVLWWRSRMVDMIDALRAQVGPHARIAWRSAHLPPASASGTVEWFIQTLRLRPSGMSSQGHRLLSPNRIVQLNNARDSMLPPRGQDSIPGQRSHVLWTKNQQPVLGNVPFGGVTLGEIAHQDSPTNPGINPNAYLFWSMVLDELREAST